MHAKRWRAPLAAALAAGSMALMVVGVDSANAAQGGPVAPLTNEPPGWPSSTGPNPPTSTTPPPPLPPQGKSPIRKLALPAGADTGEPALFLADGRIAGTAGTAGSPQVDDLVRPVIWSAGGVRELEAQQPRSSRLAGVNARGEAVGSRTVSGTSVATLWRSGQAITLGTSRPDDRDSYAFGISDQGEALVVTRYRVGEGWDTRVRVELWQDGVLRPVTDLAGYTGIAIGPGGHVVISQPGSVSVWKDGAEKVVPLPQSPGWGLFTSQVLRDGSVLGWVEDNAIRQVVRMSPAGVVTPVSDGTVNAEIQSGHGQGNWIDGRGRVAGVETRADGQHAVIWEGGRTIDLTAGFPGVSVTGMNVFGAVSGTLNDGVGTRGFLYSGGKLRLVPAQPGGLNTQAHGVHPFLPVVIGSAKPRPDSGAGQATTPFTWWG